MRRIMQCLCGFCHCACLSEPYLVDIDYLDAEVNQEPNSRSGGGRHGGSGGAGAVDREAERRGEV